MRQKLFTFLRDLIGFDPARSAKVALFVLLGGALEGISVVLFLPFFAALTKPTEGQTGVTGDWGAWLPAGASANQLLLMTCVVFLAVMIARALVLRVRDVLAFKLAITFVDHLRIDLLNRLAQTPWRKLDRLKQTDIEHALITETERVKSVSVMLNASAIDIALVLSQAAILLFLSPALGAACLGLILLAVTLLYPNVRRAFHLGHKLSETGRGIHSITTDFLQNLKTAKSQNLENRYVHFFDAAVGVAQTTHFAFKSRQLLSRSLLQIAMAAAVVIILLAGIFLFETDAATVLLVVIILGRLTPPVFRLNQNLQVLVHMLPAYEAVQDFRARFSRPTLSPPNGPDDGRAPDQQAPMLQFDAVSFGFENGPHVLKDASFTVDSGEFVAIVGPSGAGKSTLMDLALGLYQPDKGTIRLFGQPADPATATAFRNHASYIPQETFLMNATIRENLLWVCPDATPEQLDSALALSGAAAFVRAMELGLDTPVGDRGTRLSGGERQRISLAQALLRAPRVLILDEGLNAISQADVRPLLRSLRDFDETMTLIYITHRLSDVLEMDRVLMVSDSTLKSVQTGDIPKEFASRETDDGTARTGQLKGEKGQSRI